MKSVIPAKAGIQYVLDPRLRGDDTAKFHSGEAYMSVKNPQQLNEHYNELFRNADIEGLVALYEPDAVLAAAPGQLVKGRDEIRKRLSGLLALKGTLSADSQSCVELGDIVLLHANWRFSGTSAEGKPIAMSGTSSKLARRQTDGSWLYVIDLPLGGST
jgi:uncharacterized protein (TIGR02246 family)